MIYEKVSSYCEENNMSFHKLEKELGIGNGVIAKWKKRTPSTKSLKKVAKFLGVSIEELIE